MPTYPSNSQVRVSSIIHRYDRGVYTMELLLGDVIADAGIPQVSTDIEKSYVGKEAVLAEELAKEPVSRIYLPQEEVRTIRIIVEEVNPADQSLEAQYLRVEIMRLADAASATGLTSYARSVLLRRIIELKQQLGEI